MTSARERGAPGTACDGYRVAPPPIPRPRTASGDPYEPGRRADHTTSTGSEKR